MYDPSSFRVYDRLAKETIRLDYIGKVKVRFLSPPISFLSICDGIATPYRMALNLGFRVHKYFAFERYELVRAVAKGICPDIMHLDPHDFLLIDDFSKIVTMLRDANITSLAFVSDFHCTPWSRLSDHPKGFDHPQAQLVVKNAALLDTLRQENLIWTVLNETIALHKDFVNDLFTLERLVKVTYLMHNAAHSWSRASRPRLLGLEGASVNKMPESTQLFPNFVLKPM